MSVPGIGVGDLLSPDDYRRVRRERIAAIIRHKENRRISLGASLTVLFESRQTVLHQVQEVLHIEGRASSERIARTVHEYRHLLPDRRTLAATAFVDGGPAPIACGISRALASTPEVLRLQIGALRFDAASAEDPPHIACPVCYVRFELTDAAVGALLSPREDVTLVLDAGRTITAKLAAPQRRALFENLEASGALVEPPARIASSSLHT